MFRPASPRRPDAGPPLRRRSRFEALGSPAPARRSRLPGRASLQPRARGKRFVIVASQFNRSITRALVVGATDVLRRAGASSRNIRLLWVPGAFELPVVASRLAAGRPRPHAVIALGALIRGETPQYEVIAHAVAQGLTEVSVRTGVPVTCGLVVATTFAQARARAGGARGNRGTEAASAALSVLRLFDTL